MGAAGDEVTANGTQPPDTQDRIATRHETDSI
jgi:hypothetical protein